MKKSLCVFLVFSLVLASHTANAQLNVQIKSGDRQVCAGDGLSFTDSIVSGSPMSYEWISSVATFSAPSSRSTSASFNGSGDVILKTVSGATTFYDTVSIKYNVKPIVRLPVDSRICSYDSILLTAIIDTGYWVNPVTNDTTFNGNNLSKLWFYNGSSSSFSIDDSIIVNMRGEYSYEVTDALGCVGRDTFFLFVNDTVTADAGDDITLCFNDILMIQAGGLDTVGNGKSGFYKWLDITPPGPDVIIGTNNIYTFVAAEDKDFRLELYITEGGVSCYDDDSVTCFVNELPVLELGSDQDVCCDYGAIALNFSLITPAGTPATGGWSCSQYPGLVQNNFFNTDSACYLIPSGASKIQVYANYTYQDPSTLCVNSDSIKITVTGLPNLVTRNAQFCQDKEIIDLSDELVLSPANTNIGYPTWRCLDSNSVGNKFTQDMLFNAGSSFASDWHLIFDKDIYEIQNNDKDTIILEFTFVTPQGCLSKDTISVIVCRVPELAFSDFDDLCWNEGGVSLNSYTGVNLTDGVWNVVDTFGYDHPIDLGGLVGDSINTLNSSVNGGSYYLRYDHINTGCPARNDTVLTILPKQDLTIDLQSRYCSNDLDFALSGFPAGGTWSSEDSNALVNSDSFSPSNASIIGEHFIVYYAYTNSTTGCDDEDSALVKIDPEPILSIQGEDSFCYVTPGVPLTRSYLITAENSDFIQWVATDFYGNRSSMSLGSIDSARNIITFTPSGRDTFRIVVLAGGLGPCNDANDYFDVILYQDSSCILSVDPLRQLTISIYPNPTSGLIFIDSRFNVESCINSLGQDVIIENRSSDAYFIDASGIYTLLLKDRKTGDLYYKKVVVE